MTKAIYSGSIREKRFPIIFLIGRCGYTNAFVWLCAAYAYVCTFILRCVFTERGAWLAVLPVERVKGQPNTVHSSVMLKW